MMGLPCYWLEWLLVLKYELTSSPFTPRKAENISNSLYSYSRW